MMEHILQDLLEQPGIHAALVSDGGGRLHAHRGNPIYDPSLLENVASLLARAVDSMELLHEDWDALQARYADGTVMVRRLGSFPRFEGRLFLAVVSDRALNASFTTVAMRVVVQKLRAFLSRPPEPSAPSGPAVAPPPSGPPPLPSPRGSSPPDLALRTIGALDSGLREPAASSGLAWSGLGGGGPSASNIIPADPTAREALDRIARALATYVGPMAKVFVKEAARDVTRGAVFEVAHAEGVVERVAKHIERPEDRAAFVSSLARRSGGR